MRYTLALAVDSGQPRATASVSCRTGCMRHSACVPRAHTRPVSWACITCVSVASFTQGLTRGGRVLTRFCLCFLLVVGFTAACADSTAPDSPLFADLGRNDVRARDPQALGVTAMTRNVYSAAAVDVVIAALAAPDPADRVPVLPGVAAHNYSANLGVVAPGVELKRGWVQIDVLIGGERITVASTHLESGSNTTPAFPALRAAQATELVASVGAAPRAILLGDFNDTEGSPMYGVVTGAGFTDTWARLRPGVAGLTCCEPPDLSNPLPLLFERIDYVFARGLERSEERRVGKEG